MDHPLIPDDPFWSPSKLVSLLVAGAYLAVGVLSGVIQLLVQLFILCVFALACIWLSDAMGAYTGLHFTRGITRPTPGIFVYYGGWLLLMMPLATGLILWFLS